MMVITQSPNFLNEFTFAVASVKWESIRMFLLIFLQSRCGIWQFTHIYRWSEGSWFVSIWIHKEPFIEEKREPLLTLTPMGDPGWKRLLSICILPLLFHGEVNLDSPEECLAVTGGVSGSIVSFEPLPSLEWQGRPRFWLLWISRVSYNPFCGGRNALPQ